jgi:hypothetical protein
VFRHNAQDGHRVGPFLALLAASGEISPPQPDATPGPAGPDHDGAKTRRPLRYRR